LVCSRFGGGPFPPTDTTLFASLEDSNSTNDNTDISIEKGSGSSSNQVVKFWDKLSPEQKDDVKSAVISFCFALFVRMFLLEPRFIPSLSMFPTFDIGDQLLVDKISHFGRDYKKRDVIVFTPPQTYVDATGNDEALIKRIVAVGGDIVEVKDKTLFVNGIQQQEEYINEQPDYVLSPVAVPAGYCLVLGDNRNHSFDSHYWGLLPEKNIIGRAVVKYWPPWRAGFVEGSQ